MIWRLARTAEFHDEDAANHVIRVGFYCRTIAEAMGLDRDFIERIFLASPLHDIGKVAIPERILLLTS
jgi:putative two-component system response regulator